MPDQKKPKSGWIVIDPRDRSIQRPLGFTVEDGEVNNQSVGTYFGAIYYMRKHAKWDARNWRGAKIIRVRLEEI